MGRSTEVSHPPEEDFQKSLSLEMKKASGLLR